MSKHTAPTWLIRANGRLYGYSTLGVLLCDLAANRKSGEASEIFELQDAGFMTVYEPTSEAALRAQSVKPVLGTCDQDDKHGNACGKPLFWIDTIYGKPKESATCADCDEARAGLEDVS